MLRHLSRAEVVPAALLFVGTFFLRAPAPGDEPPAEPVQTQPKEPDAEPVPGPPGLPEAALEGALDPELAQILIEQWKPMPYESLDQVPPCEDAKAIVPGDWTREVPAGARFSIRVPRKARRASGTWQTKELEIRVKWGHWAIDSFSLGHIQETCRLVLPGGDALVMRSQWDDLHVVRIWIPDSGDELDAELLITSTAGGGRALVERAIAGIERTEPGGDGSQPSSSSDFD